MEQHAGSSEHGAQQGLSAQDLARIAKLSQLAIAPEQLAAMAGDLLRVLDLARSMGGEDVAKLPPLLSPLEARSQTRADDPSLGVKIDRDGFFTSQDAGKTDSSMPAKRDGAYFKVPKVLGDAGGAA